MRVLVSVGEHNFPRDVADSLSEVAEVVYHRPGEGDYWEALGDADALVAGMERIDGELLGRAPRLRIVARFGVGYDNVDVEACTRRGVYVTYTPDILSGAVADLTWGLIIALARRLIEADRFVRERWTLRRGRLPFGFDLEGKTLGIIGLGRIGSEVARRAQGFGVKVIYHDVVRKPELEEAYGAEYVSLQELLQRADIVTLHVPLLPSTERLIGEEELQMMKSTAILINTSRGKVIDQKALVKALKEGWIAGAALDVYEEEPIPLDDPLLRLENVVLTPHIGSATRETRRRMAEVCAQNVRAVLEGRRPPNLVPEQIGKPIIPP